MNQPIISVIIVTWNNENEIRGCLESVLKVEYKNFNIIVVDNNSNDRTVEIAEEFKDRVKLIKSAKNLYLTGGNNKGIDFALKNYSPDFVMVLNPDTVVETNLLTALTSEAELDDKVGMIGSKIKFLQGADKGKINSAGLIFDGFMQSYDRGFKEEDIGQFDQAKEVDGLSGACILYRVKMLNEIGLYDTRIKMYMDDLEMSIRAKKAGWKVIYTPETTVWHSYMVSTNQNKKLFVEKQKMFAWLIIALKHYSLKSKLAMVWKYVRFKVLGNNPLHSSS